MKILGAVLTDPPDDDVLAFLLPLEHGPGTDAKAPTHGRWDRDLTLRRELRLSNGHAVTLPRYWTAANA